MMLMCRLVYFESTMPPLVMVKVASESGMFGLSTSFATRSSPCPFRNATRVWTACARTWPPIGFFGSDTKVIPPPGSDVI